MAFSIPKIYTNRNVLACYNAVRGLSSSRAEARARRSAMFDAELDRQKSLVPRIEKIDVTYRGKPEPYLLKMNKHISTPLHCAQHMKLALVERSVLAKVDGELWDMQRPLEESCELDLLNFTSEEDLKLLAEVNKAFWRSCSFLLGKVVDKAFKDDFPIQLVGSPCPIEVESGSFVYDVHSEEPSWKPSKSEIQTITHLMLREVLTRHRFQRLLVFQELAQDMFTDNPLKLAQLEQLPEMVTVYRIGDHCDLSPGPMISHLGLIGRIQLASVHPVTTPQGSVYRFQGLALPAQLPLQLQSYNLLLQRAIKLNPSGLAAETAASNQQQNSAAATPS